MSHQKIREFTENASPDNWLKYADELKRTAYLLWKDKDNLWVDLNSETQERRERPAISRSFMLIAGLSIENALKAFLIAIDPSLINNGILDKKLHEHNLIKLKDLCGNIKFEEKEVELMTILSEAIPYWGRYPIPRHYEHIKAEKIVSEEIFEKYKTLFRKIFYATLDEIKGGWDAGNGVSFKSIYYRNLEEE